MATIIGTQQSENLPGTAGDDTIIGLAGHDRSTGGDGGDRFIYQRLSDLSVWTGSVLPWHETITDFGEHGNVIEPNEQDVLDLSALSDFLFIGDDEFSATGRNEYRFQRFGEFGMLLLFDKGGDGTADRYLVLDNFRGEDSLDQPSEHPIFTNLIDPHDFDYHYEVGPRPMKRSSVRTVTAKVALPAPTGCTAWPATTACTAGAVTTRCSAAPATIVSMAARASTR